MNKARHSLHAGNNYVNDENETLNITAESLPRPNA